MFSQNGLYQTIHGTPVAISTPYASHTFYLFQNDTGGNWTWHFQVDSTVEASWASTWTGTFVFAESTSNDSALHFTYQDTSLNYINNHDTNKPWKSFSGTTTDAAPAAYMCAYTSGPTSTTANLSENVGVSGDCTVKALRAGKRTKGRQ